MYIYIYIHVKCKIGIYIYIYIYICMALRHEVKLDIFCEGPALRICLHPSGLELNFILQVALIIADFRRVLLLSGLVRCADFHCVLL